MLYFVKTCNCSHEPNQTQPTTVKIALRSVGCLAGLGLYPLTLELIAMGEDE